MLLLLWYFKHVMQHQENHCFMLITRLKSVSSISSLVFSFLIYVSLEMLIPTYWQVANISQYIGWVLLKGTTAFYCAYSPDYVGIMFLLFFSHFKIVCLEIFYLIYFSVFIYFYKSALRQCLKCTTNTRVFRAVFVCTKPNTVWWLMFLADTGNLCARLIAGSSFWQSAAHNFTTSNSGSALHLLWTQTLKSTEDNELLHPFHHFVHLCLNHLLLPFTLHELLFYVSFLPYPLFVNLHVLPASTSYFCSSFHHPSRPPHHTLKSLSYTVPPSLRNWMTPLPFIKLTYWSDSAQPESERRRKVRQSASGD